MDTVKSAALQQAQTYTNMSQLSGLKKDIKQNDIEAIRAVANQFEAIFTQMMLDSMQKANDVFKSDYSNSNEMTMYQELLNKEISTSSATDGIFGIADMLMQQLEVTQQIKTTETTEA